MTNMKGVYYRYLASAWTHCWHLYASLYNNAKEPMLPTMAVLCTIQLPSHSILTTTASNSFHWSRTAGNASSMIQPHKSHIHFARNRCTQKDYAPQLRPCPYPCLHPSRLAHHVMVYRSLRIGALVRKLGPAVQALRRWVEQAARVAVSRKNAA